jgi:hypothetical protein
MHLPKELLKEAQNYFFEGLIETEDVDDGHILRKDQAMEYALGKMAIHRPDLYHTMMTLGPRSVMERVAGGYMVNTRNRNRKTIEQARDMSLAELYDSMDSEVVSYHVEGERGNRHKFVYRCTKGELRMVVQSYQKTIDGNVARRDRYQALIDKLDEAGVSDEVYIGDCLAAV